MDLPGPPEWYAYSGNTLAALIIGWTLHRVVKGPFDSGMIEQLYAQRVLKVA